MHAMIYIYIEERNNSCHNIHIGSNNPHIKTCKFEVPLEAANSHIPPNRRLGSTLVPLSHPRAKPRQETVRTTNFSFDLSFCQQAIMPNNRISHSKNPS